MSEDDSTVSLETLRQVFNEALDNLRERQARFVPKDGPALAGDYLLIDFVVLDEDGNPQTETERKNQLVMAGHEDPTALFSHKLVGLAEGDKKRIDVDFPEDFPDESLKGRSIGYNVEVSGVRSKTLPELDDHFATQVSQAENLDGQPLEKYVRLVKDCRNNFRQVLQRIDAAEMI